jgi:hypothetical protein
MDGEPMADEICGDVGLEIGERQNKIRLWGEDLVDVGRREGAHAWLVAASLRRAHNVAGDAHDAVLLVSKHGVSKVSSVGKTIWLGRNQCWMAFYCTGGERFTLSKDRA